MIAQIVCNHLHFTLNSIFTKLRMTLNMMYILFIIQDSTFYTDIITHMDKTLIFYKLYTLLFLIGYITFKLSNRAVFACLHSLI